MDNAAAGPSTPKTRRRSWFGFSSPIGFASSSSPTTRRGSKGVDVDEDGGSEKVEMTEAGPSRYEMTVTPPKEAEMGIDGEVDGDRTVRKGKKGRKSVEDSVRMEDLSRTVRARRSEDVVERTTYDPGGSVQPFPSRTFSRTASDREEVPSRSSLSHTPPLGTGLVEATPTPPHPVEISDTFFTPSDRPLPPLPGLSDKALPDVPRGIVVTPSSPRKLRKQPNSSSSSLSKLGERQPRSRSASAGVRKAHSARSSPIGLGLPRELAGEDDDRPPPLPSKPQSVSSPFPSRAASPTPRIVFAEPEVRAEKDEQKDEKTDEKKTRVKRARSLSGLLGKAPPRIEGKPPSRPHTPEPKEEPAAEETTVKASGVLGWLGVKKTVKRRQSEGRLDRAELNDAGRSKESLHPDSAGENPEASRSTDSLGSRRGSMSTPPRISRPELDHPSSSTTVVPNTQRRSIFSRRSTSRGPDSTSSSPRPRPIPINAQSANRVSGAGSSHSSLVLPHIEPSSPSYFDAQNWASSPTEGEETLFSPESGSNWGPGVRPWMDGTEGRQSTRSSLSVSSPLDILPEQASSVPAGPALRPPVVTQAGRLRSWSDAPLPQTARPSADNASQPHLPHGMSQSVNSSPIVPVRPQMPGRSSSGNAVIMSKMKNMFAKTTSRGRSQTLFRQPSSDIDEFGAIRGSSDWPRGTSMRPSSSASSDVGSRPRSGLVGSPQTALLGLSDAERRIFLNDTPERSPRTSIASSIASGTARPAKLEPIIRQGRARASTLSNAPTSYNFAPPTSPLVFPAAATPPRRRPSVIQRLSNGVLRSGPSSPRTGSLFPLPPKSSGSSSFSPFAGSTDDSFSTATSPRPSAGSISAAMGSSQLKAASALEEGDTPEVWLERVSSKIARNEIANVLASSSDDFHTAALKMFMSRFDFTHKALDVALRQLLMHMSLPRETQQIDRIIEAFSVRYEECEPRLFIQKDNTYVLAFSMMMLHTDAFNKHNKNKMTKTDYVRNTRMDGVSPLVLEAFFDNITFTPFVFIEDDADLLRGHINESTATLGTIGSLGPPSASTIKSSRIDVYHMIVGNALAALRIDVEREIPAESPFSTYGTRPFMDCRRAHEAFLAARNMSIVLPKRKTSSAGILGSTPSKAGPEPEMVLKVTKVGLLSRKDDSGDSKKNRKWKSWSVILTGSQLLFFKDPSWALTMLEQSTSDSTAGSKPPLLPRMTNFKPDEVFPVKDSIAIYDRSASTPHIFRFVMPSGRQYLLQSADTYELNEWVSLINYASAFKTANVRMRGLSMGKDSAVLAGAAAAASHKRELEGGVNGHTPATPRKAIFGETANTPERPESLPPLSPDSTTEVRAEQATVKKGLVDVDGANDAVVDEGEQLEEVFDVVKAELAAGRGGTAVNGKHAKKGKHRDEGHGRLDALQHQIKHFETKLEGLNTLLASHIRTARNLAILTPFQKVTRERIAAAIPALAAKIRTTRIDLAKFALWLEVLRNDLEHEEKDWARLRHVALQAAAKSLRDPLGVHGVVKGVNAPPSTDVPVLSLPSPPPEGENTADFGTSPAELPVMIRRASDEPLVKGRKQEDARPGLPRQSSMATYRSASESIRPELKRSTSDLLSAHDALSRPTSPGSEDGKGTGRSSPLFNLSDVEDATAHRHEDRHSSLGTNTRRPGKPQNGETADADEGKVGEIPEHWTKTRAARRVSLANIPPDITQGLSRHTSRKEGSG